MMGDDDTTVEEAKPDKEVKADDKKEEAGTKPQTDEKKDAPEEKATDEKKPEEAAPADEKKAEAGGEAGGDEAAALKLPKGEKLAYDKSQTKPEKAGSKEQPTDLAEKSDKSPLEKAAEEAPTAEEPKTEAPKDAKSTTEAPKEDKKSEVAEKEEKKPEAEKAVPE